MIEKVFRDPVHNYVHVDHPVIYDLINTKEFQRLRRNWERLVTLSTVVSIAVFHIALEHMKLLDASPKYLTRNTFKLGTTTSRS